MEAANALESEVVGILKHAAEFLRTLGGMVDDKHGTLAVVYARLLEREAADMKAVAAPAQGVGPEALDAVREAVAAMWEAEQKLFPLGKTAGEAAGYLAIRVDREHHQRMRESSAAANEVEKRLRNAANRLSRAFNQACAAQGAKCCEKDGSP